ncbi:nitrile hydratase subunit beta [Blastococcus sp. VKM Ac-2987]|uniref:nitrile hydratase subunit beta n=1 Tax=Blastococcus sp. VKM Ac-2987 TaxID=3004141 RepID=UPI0022AB684D|nr:nitrile hydratase subunit beta [Blastococcus sp. VKM Ac-2987]MCZ2861041.1 nitrile hydratase subunit beta [Blastococcus sp. VKM Ac-2987]
MHDTGGMQGFGPVRPEPDEPPFHDEWERRSFAITLALGALGLWNIDQMRHERESLPPAAYLASSYYRIWFLAVENAVRRLELLDREGLRARTAEELTGLFSSRSSYERPIGAGPVFRAGQQVRTRTINPSGHTRLPRYARGRVGTVLAVRGAHVFPDRNAVPLGQEPDPAPEWLYTVEFSAGELWGAAADPTVTVSVDAWEPYLEAV